MYEANVFAVLVPNNSNGLARDAFRLGHNAELYHPSSKGIVTEPGLSSREPTPAPPVPKQPNDDGNDDDGNEDRLILTFDCRPRDPLRGWQFGTNTQTSDILLGHRGTLRISARHFSLNIDEDGRVVLRDDSTNGTSVGYDGQAEYLVRRNFKWILSLEPGNVIRLGRIIIHIPGGCKLAFNIEFPNHRQGKTEYLANLQASIKAGKAALPPVTALGLDSSTTTAAPSQPRTPCQSPIYVTLSLIGRGEFGEVHRVFDVSAGKIYAGKRFHPPSGKGVKGKRKLGHDKWMDGVRNEMRIMKENPHSTESLACLPNAISRVSISLNELYHDMREERDENVVAFYCITGNICLVIYWMLRANIMPFIDFLETSDPLLVMPFYRLGSLDTHKGVTEEKCVSAFHQILLGLRHLHQRNIVHRDLKPANLLVAEPFTIIIADFGLSKDATDHLLTTFCGTHLYAAPEVYPGHSNGYGPLVDIWSTGVIMLELMYTRPAGPSMKGVTLPAWNKRWSKILVETVGDWNPEEDKVIEILTHMVRIAPEERLGADKCLEKGFNSGLFSLGHDDQSGDAKVIPGSED